MTQIELRDRLRTKRRDSSLLLKEATVTSKMTPNRQPQTATRLDVTASDVSAILTVKLVGLNNKKEILEETLIFNTNGTKITTNAFDKLDYCEIT